MFSLRLFETADIPAAIALWQNCPGVAADVADSPERVAAFLAANPRLSFVAEVDEVLTGTVLCSHDTRRGFIYHLAVDPEERRTGQGRALANAALRALAAAGVAKCHIHVLAENATARAFWSNIGWTSRRDIDTLSRLTG